LFVVLAFAAALSAQPREPQAGVAPALSIELTPDHNHYRTRIASTAQAASAQYRRSLGSPPVRLQIGDLGHAHARNASTVELELPWRSSPPAMEIEAQVAFAMARAWWPGWLADPLSRPIVDGLAWYLQGRVVPALFDLSFLRPGYQADSVRLFGDAVPWAFPLLTLGQPGPRLPRGADPGTPRMALAWATIERMVGWPALEGALATLGESASTRSMPPAEIAQVVSSATGYPLGWFLAVALDPARTFDYQLGSVVTRACNDPSCIRTDVTVINRGNTAFDSPVAQGPYDTSGILEIRVAFADGQTVSSRWNGREPSRVLSFESIAAPIRVELDPDRVLMLDRSRLDDRWQAAPAAELAPTWVAWWLLWLQDASLSYSGLF